MGSERCICFFFQAEDGIRDVERSRGLGAGAVVVGITLQSGTYPANGRNVIVQGNFVDAASKFTNTSADLVEVVV